MKSPSEGTWKMHNCVKWSQFVVTMLAVVGIITGTFAYIMQNHQNQPHENAARQTQIDEIKEDLKAVREESTQTRVNMGTISAKLDNVEKGINEVKALIR